MVKIVLWSHLITSCGVVPTNYWCSGLVSSFIVQGVITHSVHVCTEILTTKQSSTFEPQDREKSVFQTVEQSYCLQHGGPYYQPEGEELWSQVTACQAACLPLMPPHPPTTSHLPPNNPCMPPTSMQPSSGESHVTAYRTGHRQLKGTPAADSPI